MQQIKIEFFYEPSIYHMIDIDFEFTDFDSFFEGIKLKVWELSKKEHRRIACIMYIDEDYYNDNIHQIICDESMRPEYSLVKECEPNDLIEVDTGGFQFKIKLI